MDEDGGWSDLTVNRDEPMTCYFGVDFATQMTRATVGGEFQVRDDAGAGCGLPGV